MAAHKSNPTQTVLTIVIGFLLLELAFNLGWSLYVAITVGTLGLLSTTLSKGIETVWMKLAKALSYIIPNILLSAVFYLILFPLSLLSKLFGSKNELHLKNKDTHSWKVRSEKIEKVSFEKMW